jgi:cytochrome c biogenesis protein CcmG, thiol:disulfide interchange protein DsbE
VRYFRLLVPSGTCFSRHARLASALNLRPTIPLAGIAALLLIAAGCGSGDPESAASRADFRRALAGAPAPLARLYSRPAALVPGGKEEFRRQLRELRGYPVVVNKWASWCGPCRHEFPFFQEQALKRGKRVAFLGVDAQDAREDARRFLAKLPVPYPSFFDPDLDIAEELEQARSFPTTTFYDARGELVYTKPGGYASEAALADDVAEYALGGARGKPGR